MIVLLTDFHNSDCVGLVKGVIKSTYPGAEIVDLSHSVPSFRVRTGAWVLMSDYSYFPPGTVFYCVIDPGVGARRRAIALQTTHYFFVGPDNGLLFPAASKDGILSIVELERGHSSRTFEGRDVFAPAAAKLDAGTPVASLGQPVRSLVPLDVSASAGKGEIMIIEHYGNIVTNIEPTAQKETYKVSCGHFTKNLKLYPTFALAQSDELFLLVGSKGTFELVVYEGAASSMMPCQVGDSIRIE